MMFGVTSRVKTVVPLFVCFVPDGQLSGYEIWNQGTLELSSGCFPVFEFRTAIKL